MKFDLNLGKEMKKDFVKIVIPEIDFAQENRSVMQIDRNSIDSIQWEVKPIEPRGGKV